MVHGLLHARRVGQALPDGPTTVVLAMGDHGPAVIFTRLQSVEFIAPLRAVLHHPQAPIGAPSCPLRVSVSPAPNVGVSPFACPQRVVVGHSAINREPDHLAQMVAEVLRVSHAVIALAQA